MWFSFAPTKVPQVLFATNLWIRNCIIAMAADMEEVLIADMQHWPDCLADIIHSHSGVKVFIEQEVLALTRVVNGQTEHARMDLVFNLHGFNHVFGRLYSCSLLLQSVLVSAASTKPGLMAKRAEKTKFDRYPHTSILSRSFLRQLADLAHMPGNSLIICCEMLITHQLLSETLGPPSRVFSTVPSPNNNSWQPLRDLWDLLSHPAAIYIRYLCLQVPATRDCTQPISVSRTLQLCHVALL